MPSYLKKFCASAPAVFPGPPGVPTLRRRVLIRAWARLVGIRRGRFDVAAPAGRLAGRCGLCCVAVGWRLCACRCDLLASTLCVVGFRLLAIACGGLSGWSAGCRLCPCPVLALVEAVRLCSVGGLWGAYISSSQRLSRACKTPSGVADRPPGGLFLPLPSARYRRPPLAATPTCPLPLVVGFPEGHPR